MSGFNLRSIGAFSKENDSYNNDGLKLTNYFSDDSISLSSQTPKNYPTEFIEVDERYKVCVEGMIYNIDIKEQLSVLMDFVKEKDELKIANLISDWDGEFVIIIIDTEDGKYTVINDSWGRLPIYYWAQDGQFIITRNISYITQNINLEYEPEVLGISVLLGLTLGQDTIWKKVSKLPPHSMLTYDLSEKQVSGGSYFDLRTVSGDIPMDDLKDEIKKVLKSH